MPEQRRVIVIGAGVGGLAAAVALAAQGAAVTVLERAAAPGGKMREVPVGDARIDAGPTVFTMRWVFEALFALAGTSLDAELSLARAELIARHAWDDSGHLDLFADLAQSADAIGDFSGARDAHGFLAFSDEARRIYNTLKGPFISSSKTNPLGLTQRVGREGLGGMLHIKPYGTLWKALGKHFRDQRLQQLFGRYATYAGSSPFLSPATLMLIAHVEQDGVWLVEGGMHQLAVTLARLAARHGAEICYATEAAEIEVRNGRVSGVRLAGPDGARLEADAVVFNGDVSALGAGLLGGDAVRAAAPTAPTDRSLSALTWNLVATTAGLPLVRHSVFFCDDYPAEFRDIFGRQRLPQSPTVYVCAQDRGATAADTAALSGQPERLLLLVNAPAIGDRYAFTPADIARCRDDTYALLQRCGLALEHPDDACHATTPTEFEQLFPATGGALYGRASHGWRASFQRPGARTKVPGLYLAGGSTHPGAGVPMAALSGSQAAEAVLQDMVRARRAAGS